MKKATFSLMNHPWLFLLVYILSTILCNVLILVLLIGVLKLPGDSPITDLWANVLTHGLVALILTPFVFGFHDRSRPYSAYLSEIHLTNVKPVGKLLLLGVSCFLFLALSQVAGTVIYRLSQGLVVDQVFISGAFPIASEFPPNSWGFLVSLISVFEEIAFRGVVLAMFIRFYSQPKAVLFSALGFGILHIFTLFSGREPIWVLGQIVWASFLGVFYGYVTLKTGSLLPAMLVHYLGNLFIYPLTAYIQNNAPIPVQVYYGVILTLGVIPVVLMSLWARAFTSWWSMTPKT